MIFIDFGLLRSPYGKYLTSLLTLRYVLKFDNLDNLPVYDSVCEDTSRIHGKCRQRFYLTFTDVFFLNFTFLAYLNVFF